MVRISTIYDKTINKRVFLVRGDERYAHSTSTIVSVGNKKSITAYGFVVPITVNVRRDIGSSKVVVYDNDNVINVIDWSESQVNGLPFDSPSLAWDSEHIIKVKYMGNSQCSPSSATYTIAAEPNPNKYQTSMEFSKLTQLASINTEYTAEVQITTEQLSIDGETITFYLDGETIGSATVDENKASITYSSTNAGKSRISASFVGSTNHYPSQVEAEIGFGLDVQITNTIPTIALRDGSNFDISVKPFIEEYEEELSYTFRLEAYNPRTSRYETIYNQITRSGESFSVFTYLNEFYLKVRARINFKNKVYYSPEYDLKMYQVIDVLFDEPPIAVNGFLSNITGTLDYTGNADLLSVPIDLTGAITERIYSDELGGFEIDYWGTGEGNVSITATIPQRNYPATATINFEDVLQYWSRTNGEYNQSYSAANARVLKLNNGYKLECIDNAKSGVILFPPLSVDDDYTVEYDQIMGSGDRTRVQIGTIVYNGQTEWTGKHIKYVREDGVGSLYIDGVLEQQEPDTLAEFRFGLNLYGGGQKGYKQSYLLIDNFKLKRGA